MDYKRETADNRRLPAVYFCTGGEARTFFLLSFRFIAVDFQVFTFSD